MRYWEEMHDKFGFGDGGSIPPDAEACRSIYVQAINAYAKIRGSNVRIVAFNRNGCHNSCMLEYVSKSDFSDVPIEDGVPTVDGGKFFIDHPKVVIADDILEEIITDLMLDEDLDGFVQVKVKIDKDFQNFLKEIK